VAYYWTSERRRPFAARLTGGFRLRRAAGLALSPARWGPAGRATRPDQHLLCMNASIA